MQPTTPAEQAAQPLRTAMYLELGHIQLAQVDLPRDTADQRVTVS